MFANPTNLFTLLESQTQKTVPIFQRPYSWSERSCRRLWRDVVEITADPSRIHFTGSIVELSSPATGNGPHQSQVIDGQQRLVSVALLLLALGNVAERDGYPAELHRQSLVDLHLILSGRTGEDRYKLLLTKHDRDTLLALIDGDEPPGNASQRVMENYAFFVRQLSEYAGDLSEVYRALWRLSVVHVGLFPGEDNPQMIFESLNATGEDLMKADLIRNFLLMNLPLTDQESIYNRYWFPMETSFGQDGLVEHFDSFMRAYLSMKLSRLVDVAEVYEEFKKYVTSPAAPGDTSAVVQDLEKYSRYFLEILMLRPASTPQIGGALSELGELKLQKAYRPLLLRVWDEYKSGRMSEADLVQAIKVIQSFILRRAVCRIGANRLDILFAEMTKSVSAEHQLRTVSAELLAGTGSARFPNNQEFEAALVSRDMYNFKQRDYVLRRLENSGHSAEPIANLRQYTVEHVLPQNDNLPEPWQNDLGEQWRELRDKYLHTLGNLTLTGYNSRLSDNSFVTKRDMPGGFANSPLYLNVSLATLDAWNEDAIKTRAETLAARSLTLWPLPVVDQAAVHAARSREGGDEEPTQTPSTFFDDFGPPALALYNDLESGILALGSDVNRFVYDTRVTFKAYRIFAQVNARRSKVLVLVDLTLDEFDDPMGICEDLTNRGHHGVLNMQVSVSLYEHVAFALELVRRSYEKHSIEPLDSDES
ncbi:MAG TPA: DUF262 and DUF1524 domain-containing protein [Coriobacteriia bacterium]